jgi:hypothetical protein
LFLEQSWKMTEVRHIKAHNYVENIFGSFDRIISKHKKCFFEKLKFLNSQKWPQKKMHKTSSSGASQNSIFISVFMDNFGQKSHLEKKKLKKFTQKTPENAPNLGFLKFQNLICCRKWPKNRPISTPQMFHLVPNSLSRIFYIAQLLQKFMKKILPLPPKSQLWGEDIIKCWKIQKCLNMATKKMIFT